MKIVHFCAGLQFWNGMANTARQFIAEEIAQGHESFLTNELVVLSRAKSGDYAIVYIHGAWLPVLWRAAKHAKRINAKLIIRPAGSYDPVRLGYHSWKKKLAAFFERRMLRRADVLLGTCEAEAKWIKDYVGEGCPKVEITDLKRFFKFGVRSEGIRPLRVLATHRDASKPSDREAELGVRGGEVGPCRSVEGVEGVSAGGSFDLNHGIHGLRGKGDELGDRGQELGDRCLTHKKLNVLYLGRRHPLKGVEYLERAVREISTRSTRSTRLNIELRIVSDAKGEELERVWDWCDVLVLPTLSENFGRVVAEALERGKRVITTDGAPVWGQELGVSDQGLGVRGQELVYLKGYRDGSEEERVELLKKAILFLAAKNAKSAKGLYD